VQGQPWAFSIFYVLCVYTIAVWCVCVFVCVCIVCESGQSPVVVVLGGWRESEDSLGEPVLSFHVGSGGLNSGGRSWWQALLHGSPHHPGLGAPALFLEVLRN